MSRPSLLRCCEPGLWPHTRQSRDGPAASRRVHIREEILDELGLPVSEAAKVLDVRRATLSGLINGNAALSAEMALRIEKAFGVKMETLLNM